MHLARMRFGKIEEKQPDLHSSSLRIANLGVNAQQLSDVVLLM